MSTNGMNLISKRDTEEKDLAATVLLDLKNLLGRKTLIASKRTNEKEKNKGGEKTIGENS